jgi:hypothetical protein
MLLAFGNIRYSADEADGRWGTPVSLKISKGQGLYPAGLAVSPTEPELVPVALRFGGIEHCVKGRPNPFRIVRLHSIHELFNCGPIRGDAENFFGPRIPAKDPTERIVLP